MIKEDIPRFTRALSFVAVALGHATQDGLYDAYFFALSDQITIEQFEQACKLALTRCKWFPKPQELLQLIDNTDFEVGEAWNLAVKHVRDQPRAITFSDLLINATIRRLGGRSVFSRIGSDALERFWKPKFDEQYRILKLQGQHIPPALLAPLPAMVSLEHVVSNRDPIFIECEYSNSILKIEQKADTEIASLVSTLADSLSVKPRVRNESLL